MQATRGTSLNDASTPSDQQSRARQQRRARLAVVVGALVLAADVVTKILAVEHLADRAPIQVLGELLELRLTRNPGAAFSLGTEYTLVLTVFAIGVVAVVAWLLRSVARRDWALALGLLLGGALGNLVDRIFRDPGPLRGHVVDFLELPNWPVFNLADCAIVVAAVLIAWLSIRGVQFDTPKPSDDDRG